MSPETSLAIFSLLSAFAAAFVYGRPFGWFYPRVITSRSDKFTAVGIKAFFSSSTPSPDASSHATVGEERRRAMAEMAALAASLKALAAGYLGAIVSLFWKLIWGPPILECWRIAGWTVLVIQVIALPLLVVQVIRGTIRKHTRPAVGGGFSRRVRKWWKPGTPTPYTVALFAGSIVAVLMATSWASAPPPTQTPPTQPPRTQPPLTQPPRTQPPPTPVIRSYSVEPGDTLWAVAERFYGDGRQYPQIAFANSVADPNRIHPGQVLTIPWPPPAPR